MGTRHFLYQPKNIGELNPNNPVQGCLMITIRPNEVTTLKMIAKSMI